MKLGDKVAAHYTIPVTSITTGETRRKPGPHDGETGTIIEVIGNLPTFRIHFGYGRDAYLCEESLELVNA